MHKKGQFILHCEHECSTVANVNQYILDTHFQTERQSLKIIYTYQTVDSLAWRKQGRDREGRKKEEEREREGEGEGEGREGEGEGEGEEKVKREGYTFGHRLLTLA